MEGFKWGVRESRGMPTAQHHFSSLCMFSWAFLVPKANCDVHSAVLFSSSIMSFTIRSGTPMVF